MWGWQLDAGMCGPQTPRVRPRLLQSECSPHCGADPPHSCRALPQRPRARPAPGDCSPSPRARAGVPGQPPRVRSTAGRRHSPGGRRSSGPPGPQTPAPAPPSRRPGRECTARPSKHIPDARPTRARALALRLTGRGGERPVGKRRALEGSPSPAGAASEGRGRAATGLNRGGGVPAPVSRS